MRTKGKPVTHGYDEQGSLLLRKRNAIQIIKDFCLPIDISKELIKRVEQAETMATIDRVLKEARYYL